MTTLSEAVSDFKNVISKFNPQNQPYSEIEIAKLSIADALLKQLNLQTTPCAQSERFSTEPVKFKKLRMGFVYLMRNQRNKFTKIGWSKSPTLREKTLQSEEPEIELLWSAPGTLADEAALHLKYQNERVRGEWFNLATTEISKIKELIFL